MLAPVRSLLFVLVDQGEELFGICFVHFSLFYVDDIAIFGYEYQSEKVVDIAQLPLGAQCAVWICQDESSGFPYFVANHPSDEGIGQQRGIFQIDYTEAEYVRTVDRMVFEIIRKCAVLECMVRIGIENEQVFFPQERNGHGFVAGIA